MKKGVFKSKEFGLRCRKFLVLIYVDCILKCCLIWYLGNIFMLKVKLVILMVGVIIGEGFLIMLVYLGFYFNFEFNYNILRCFVIVFS